MRPFTVPGRWLGSLTAAALAVTMLAGCGSSGDSSGSTSQNSGGRSGTLVIGATGTPSLDPTQVAPPYFWPTYATPIFQAPDGSYVGELATKWGYEGTDNKSFSFTLRSGAKFSDGTPVTPEAVVASMKRFIAAPGPVAVSAGPVADIVTKGADTVVIKYKIPVPLEFAILSLTQSHSFGAIISPAGLKNQAALVTTPSGAGPYKLDPGATTSGSVYTFVPNENYWAQDTIRYDKVVIRTIADQSSLLSAVQTGQIDYDTSLANNSAATAKAAGLNVVTQQGSQSTVMSLQSRLTGPLANVKVRQALSYAIPRTQIISAALGGQGKATTSVGTPGTLGYNQPTDNLYDYDAAKAKSLLAEAGYPSGFSVKAIAQEPADSTLAQAVASALQAVGVKVDLTINSGTFPQYVAALQSKKYDLSFGSNPSFDVYSLVNFTLAPGGTNNAFSAPIDDIQKLLDEAAAAPANDQAKAFASVTAAIDDQALLVPIALGPAFYALDKKVQNVPASFPASYFLINPFGPTKALSWYGS